MATINDKILFINDAFYKYTLPNSRNVDEAELVSLVRLNQTTLVVDLLTDSLYSEIYSSLESQSFAIADVEELFPFVQRYLATCVYIDLHDDDAYKLKRHAMKIKRDMYVSRITSMIVKSTDLTKLTSNPDIGGFESEDIRPDGTFFL